MNLFDLPKLVPAEEETTILTDHKNVRIERIVSTGQVSDWYDQRETEFVLLLDGNATIEYENRKMIALSKGDTLVIQPHEKHRVCYTSSEPPCIWLCVFWE